MCDTWQTSAKLSVAVGVLALGLCCTSKSIYKSGGSLGHLVIATAVAVMCYFIKSNMSDTFNSNGSGAGAGNTILPQSMAYFEIYFFSTFFLTCKPTHPLGGSVALGLCIAYGVIAGLQLLVVASDCCDNTAQRSAYIPLANFPGSIQTSGNNATLPVYTPQPAAAPTAPSVRPLMQACMWNLNLNIVALPCSCGMFHCELTFIESHACDRHSRQATKFCISCGVPAPREARFCQNCGNATHPSN